ncbi:MAG TPA: branched-chain amino acid ABC transporter permease [Candidatus Dormibacteraeota bacterium]|nr:branched-chain amino acid ABC transporter permease [Candidatus Dormibacteraeota bacterium]
MPSVDTAAVATRVRRAPTTYSRIRYANNLASQAFPAVLIGVLILMVVIVAIQDGTTTAVSELRNGLTIGAIYALIAVGYTMVYGIIELINFAHGDVFTLSAFYAILFTRLLDRMGFSLDDLATLHGVPGFVATMVILLPATMLAAGITGMLIERIAYRRLRNSPRLAPLITAIGVSFLIEGVMFADFGSANVRTGKENWIRGNAFTIGGVTVSWKDVFVVAAALGLMFALQAFVRYTRLGKAMRATAQDRDAALLSGININRTIAATFFIGSALAAAGAIIFSIKDDIVVWNLGFRFGIIAFTCAVLGGIGNIVGAGMGGFLVGVIAVFGAQLVGSAWDNSIIFAMLIIVLTFRPVGLLGMRVADRA